GVGEGVEGDHHVVGVALDPPAAEVGADEPGPTGHHHAPARSNGSLAALAHENSPVIKAGSRSARRGLPWSRPDSTGSVTPQSAPTAGSSQATPSPSSGL